MYCSRREEEKALSALGDRPGSDTSGYWRSACRLPDPEMPLPCLEQPRRQVTVRHSTAPCLCIQPWSKRARPAPHCSYHQDLTGGPPPGFLQSSVLEWPLYDSSASTFQPGTLKCFGQITTYLLCVYYHGRERLEYHGIITASISDNLLYLNESFNAVLRCRASHFVYPCQYGRTFPGLPRGTGPLP